MKKYRLRLKQAKKVLGHQAGQTALIVTLILAVVGVAALATISQTTTDIKISQQQEESARAFSAAEAGIEELLRPGAGTTFSSPDLGSGASVDATITEATGYTTFLFPDDIVPGQGATLWLAEHIGDDLDETNTYEGDHVDVCWESGAIEVSLYYKDPVGNYQVVRGAYDPDGATRLLNGFAQPDGSGCLDLGNSEEFNFAGDFGIDPVTNALLFANIRPYYATTKIGIEAAVGQTLPSQGHLIESTGSVGDITRKVNVFRSWPAPPAIFDYALFSGGDLAK